MTSALLDRPTARPTRRTVRLTAAPEAGCVPAGPGVGRHAHTVATTGTGSTAEPAGAVATTAAIPAGDRRGVQGASQHRGPRLMPVPDSDPPFEDIPPNPDTEAMRSLRRTAFRRWAAAAEDTETPASARALSAGDGTAAVGTLATRAASTRTAPGIAAIPAPRSGAVLALAPDAVRRAARRSAQEVGPAVSAPPPARTQVPITHRRYAPAGGFRPVVRAAERQRSAPVGPGASARAVPQRAPVAIPGIEAPAQHRREVSVQPRSDSRADAQAAFTVRPAVITSEVPDWSTDDDMGIRTTSSAALPLAVDAGTVLVRGLIEALSGRRSLDQLRAHCSPQVFAGLEDLPALQGAMGPAAGKVRPAGVAPIAVWACEPADGVAEVSAAFRCGDRTRALALRMEGIDGHWRITALHLG